MYSIVILMLLIYTISVLNIKDLNNNSNRDKDIKLDLKKEETSGDSMDCSLVASIYNDSTYTEGTGVSLTAEGAILRDWDYDTTKYLEVKVDSNNDGKRHIVEIDLPQELYVLNDITTAPAGFDSVSFEKNNDISVNGETSTYVVNTKSGKLTYEMSQNAKSVTLNLEIRYDRTLWDKQANSKLTEGDAIRVSVKHEGEEGEKVVKIGEAYVGRELGLWGGQYNEQMQDKRYKVMHLSFTANNQSVTEKYYMREAVYEIEMPYYLDSMGKHYLQYEMNEDKQVYFADNKFNNVAPKYEVLEANEQRIKLVIKNLNCVTGEQIRLKVNVPTDIDTDKDTIQFNDGKFKVSGTNNSGVNNVVLFDSAIGGIRFNVKKGENVSIVSWGKEVTYDKKIENGVMLLGGISFRNNGIDNSEEKK